MKLTKFIVLPALVLAFNAHADCPSTFPGERPEVPNGASADTTEMVAAQKAIQTYVVEGEKYLACHKLSSDRHNAYMDRIEQLASKFNGERAVYLGRQSFASIILGTDNASDVFIGREAVAGIDQ